MTEPLLHLIDPDGWQAAQAAGVIAPPSLAEVGFVHLSTPEQVALPANQLFPGRTDILLLVLDPERRRRGALGTRHARRSGTCASRTPTVRCRLAPCAR